MRWLIDEGVPKAVVEWFAGRGDDALDVAASDLRGSPDVRLWRLVYFSKQTKQKRGRAGGEAPALARPRFVLLIGKNAVASHLPPPVSQGGTLFALLPIGNIFGL
ncbi:MAG: hypothetical protein FJ291_19895 [Planctomycetes bacterium]|nr:hypothetical protein [Planctomycetota bacterium]